MLLSLCLPTNGVIEWVFPVLDSIYNQGVSEYQYEVVVTDNGHNDEFKARIKEYAGQHTNLAYYEVLDAPLFLSEPEAYKRAQGDFIKFVNHRTKLREGTLRKLIQFAQNNIHDKPIIYYGNSLIDDIDQRCEYDTFDEFVRGLSNLSTWSTGMAIWKSDLDRLKGLENSDYNYLFPHTTILFAERHRGRYIIDNARIFDEIAQGKKAKGEYNLFHAFGVEYPGIILDLYRDGDITCSTFKYVLDQNLRFIAGLCVQYRILRLYCCYDLGGYKDMLGVFYKRLPLYVKELQWVFCYVWTRIAASLRGN